MIPSINPTRRVAQIKNTPIPTQVSTIPTTDMPSRINPSLLYPSINLCTPSHPTIIANIPARIFLLSPPTFFNPSENSLAVFFAPSAKSFAASSALSPKS